MDREHEHAERDHREAHEKAWRERKASRGPGKPHPDGPTAPSRLVTPEELGFTARGPVIPAKAGIYEYPSKERDRATTGTARSPSHARRELTAEQAGKLMAEVNAVPADKPLPPALTARLKDAGFDPSDYSGPTTLRYRTLSGVRGGYAVNTGRRGRGGAYDAPRMTITHADGRQETFETSGQGKMSDSYKEALAAVKKGEAQYAKQGGFLSDKKGNITMGAKTVIVDKETGTITDAGKLRAVKPARTPTRTVTVKPARRAQYRVGGPYTAPAASSAGYDLEVHESSAAGRYLSNYGKKVKTRDTAGPDNWDPFNLAKPRRMRGKRVR